MAAMLESFVPRIGCDVVRNPSNLGFVASANFGMARHPGHDIVLLNSDTEVPPGWLQRLRAAAYRSDDTGTVTPFSNAGSLASYPLPNVENPLPDDASLLQLDRYFELANADICIDTPTGVGFCFFIRHDCLEKTGMFDADLFGRGYGEENDFCLRATACGWKHVLAADCFVYHRGHGSFGDEKNERVQHAYAALVSRHPHYQARVQRHFAADPARACRLRVDALRLARQDNVARFTVGAAATPDKGSEPLLNLSVSRPGLFELRWANTGEGFRLWFRLPEETDELLSLLSAVGINNLNCLRHPTLPYEFTRRARERGSDRIGQTELLNLVSRHGTPRLTLMQSSARMLAHLGLQMSEWRLLRPLAALVPTAMRAHLRQWLRRGGT